MGYLLDTNAVSEIFRKRPNRRLCRWLETLPAESQYISTVVLAELYVAAYRSSTSKKWFRRIDEGILTVVEVLDFDPACARLCGKIQADLMDRGEVIETPDAQIAATAVYRDLTLVTANAKHFHRIVDLSVVVFEPGEDGNLRLPDDP